MKCGAHELPLGCARDLKKSDGGLGFFVCAFTVKLTFQFHFSLIQTRERIVVDVIFLFYDGSGHVSTIKCDV